MPSVIRAAFFDVDGVLVDSLGQHLRICEDMNKELGLGLTIPDAPQLKRRIRSGVRISPMKFFFLAVGFPESAAELADVQYQRVFMQRYTPLPFPGVDLMLAHLAANGVSLGLVTANVSSNVDLALGELLGRFDPRFRFTKDDPRALSKADALKAAVHELELEPHEAIYVGDLDSDGTAARDAGVPFLGVTYGWGISTDDESVFRTAGDPSGIAEVVLTARDLVPRCS